MSPFRHAPTIEVDKPFSDVMRHLNIGGFVNVWGRRGRFVFSGDLMYVNMRDGYGTGPLSAFQVPGLGVPIPPGASADAKIDSRQFTFTMQGGYRIVDVPEFTLDLLGGARFWHISNDVDVTAEPPSFGTRSASHGEDFSWMDPLIGMRAFVPLADGLSLQAQADIGGFGAGASHTWSVLATVNHVVSGRLSASVGYKRLDVDYDHGGHIYDTRLGGPVLGLTYRF